VLIKKVSQVEEDDDSVSSLRTLHYIATSH